MKVRKDEWVIVLNKILKIIGYFGEVDILMIFR